MTKTTVIIITGYPATGKTTLAHRLADELRLPLVWKDGIKEPLMDALPEADGGWSVAWSRKLGRATFVLLYRQIETLLRAGVDMIVESHFDPAYANADWRALAGRYPLRAIQVCCHTAPAVRVARYKACIASGERHPGHVTDIDDDKAQDKWSGPPTWLDVPRPRIAVDTTVMATADYMTTVAQISELLGRDTGEADRL